MMHHRFTYEDTLNASERIDWRVEDLIGGDRRLDFSRPFMPETLARTGSLDFLGAPQRLALNQIRGAGYLGMFGLVEEFILPFVLDHARTRLDADDYRVRALLGFAAEEAKHIHLFRTFGRHFELGFRTPCALIGPAEAVAREVLSHHPLSVALTILHVEWMTQAHYVDGVKDDAGMDPCFQSLLKHHWMEEAQHAKLDTLMVEALAEACGDDEIDRAVDGYLAIGGFLDQGLGQQVEFDLAAFERATGRVLDEAERAAFRASQRGAQRWTYLGSGMTHPNFVATLDDLSPTAKARVAEAAAALA